jgi:hypothetical protein
VIQLEQLFPLSGKVRPGNIKTAARTIGLYLALGIACNLITLFLGWIPYLGPLIQIIAIFTGLYCIFGIVWTAKIFYRSDTDNTTVR